MGNIPKWMTKRYLDKKKTPSVLGKQKSKRQWVGPSRMSEWLSSESHKRTSNSPSVGPGSARTLWVGVWVSTAGIEHSMEVTWKMGSSTPHDPAILQWVYSQRTPAHQTLAPPGSSQSPRTGKTPTVHQLMTGKGNMVHTRWDATQPQRKDASLSSVPRGWN